MLQGLSLLVFASLLAAAAICDLRSYRIPNLVPVLLVAAFLAFAPFHVPPASWLGHLGAGALVFAAGFAAFCMGAFGGGDVKLLAAASLWIGFGALMNQLTSVALLGGLFGLVLLVLRAIARRSTAMQRVAMLHVGAPIPYAVPIALGSLLTAIPGAGLAP